MITLFVYCLPEQEQTVMYAVTHYSTPATTTRDLTC